MQVGDVMAVRLTKSGVIYLEKLTVTREFSPSLVPVVIVDVPLDELNEELRLRKKKGLLPLYNVDAIYWDPASFTQSTRVIAAESAAGDSGQHTGIRKKHWNHAVDHITLAQVQQMKLRSYGPFGRHRNTTSSPVVSQCARASTVLASAPVCGVFAETPLVPHTSTVPTVSDFFKRAAAALPTTPTVFEPVHTTEKLFKDRNSFVAEAMRSYKSESESEVAEYDTDDAADDAEMLMYRADDDAYYNRYQLNQSRPMHNPPHHNPAVQASWCTYCGKWYCTCSSACADSRGTTGSLPSWM